MTTQSQLDAILHGAAFAEIGATAHPAVARAFLRITGSDATRWLNGMVTNNIAALAPGEGNYNFLLNAQGRIQGDCTIYREPADGPATYLLEADSSQLAAIEQILDKFIIMDDVELAPKVLGQTGLRIIGPNSNAILKNLNVERPQALRISSATSSFGSVTVVAPVEVPNPWLDIYGDTEAMKELQTYVALAATHIDWLAFEQYRIYSGTPKYGIDIRDRDLPQETAQSHALHFAKGCYLGQEIVERIRSRGQVHRTFTRFTLAGSLPLELPAPLEANAKPAGEITSATCIYDEKHGDTLYALGYARREALDTHATLTYPGGTATPLANWNTGKLETGS